MNHHSFLKTPVAIVAAALLFSACGGGSTATLPSAATPFAPMAGSSGPAPCTGQTTTSLFATSATTTLESRSKRLCVPAFGDFGGTIALPPSRPTVTATFTSSTTNYNGQLPTLAKKGKPIFYLQFQTSGGNTFGKIVRGGDGLVGKKLIAGHAYTVYGQATTGSGGILHLIINLGPCSTTAASGNDGGVLVGIGKLLKAQKLTNGPSTIIYDIYTGKLVKQPC
jgi:hypothetical protein